MGILIFLIPLALVLSGVAVLAYAWACRSGQLDDLDSPAYKMLIDDRPGADRPSEPHA